MHPWATRGDSAFPAQGGVTRTPPSSGMVSVLLGSVINCGINWVAHLKLGDVFYPSSLWDFAINASWSSRFSIPSISFISCAPKSTLASLECHSGFHRPPNDVLSGRFLSPCAPHRVVGFSGFEPVTQKQENLYSASDLVTIPTPLVFYKELIYCCKTFLYTPVTNCILVVAAQTCCLETLVSKFF